MIAIGFLMPRRRNLWREAVKLSRIERDLRRLKGRLPALVDDRDVRERVDQLPREVGLRTLHQRRHHNGEPDTGRDARDGHDRLPNPEANVRKRDFEDELHGPPDLARTPRRLAQSGYACGRGPERLGKSGASKLNEAVRSGARPAKPISP